VNNNDAEAATHGHAVRNAALLANLTSRGVDLAAPRSVEHHFWSRTQRDAALLAHELYKRGYLLLVLAPAAHREGSEYEWNVEAGAKQSAAVAGSDATAQELVDLAMSLNSRYDGWGTAI
jgi:regulator of RNase E activity RraB